MTSSPRDRVWWRLEIRGRPGWFKPAAEAHFDPETPEDHIRSHLLSALVALHGSMPSDNVVLSKVLHPTTLGRRR